MRDDVYICELMKPFGLLMQEGGKDAFLGS
jgi:hypothetical protein